LTGILTSDQTKNILGLLRQKPGVETLAEPEVITFSGRETEIKATVIDYIITKYAYRETPTNLVISPQTSAVETGPALDVTPFLLSDGYTIVLNTTASVTDFLGYDQPTNTVAIHNKAGKRLDLPQVLPCLCIRKASTQVKLRDGQTVALELTKQLYESGIEINAEPKFFTEAKTPADQEDKEMLVFITATVVDAAGNRFH